MRTASTKSESDSPPGHSQSRLGTMNPSGAEPGVHLHQRDHGERDQHDQLDAQQRVLHPGGDLDAAVADVGHEQDPHDARDGGPQLVVGQLVQPEQAERVGARDLREVGHHDDVGGDDAPAAHPARARPERPGRPRERGAAIGLGLVQLAVGHGDEVHRHEGQQHDRGRLLARDHDDEPEARRQAVGGSRGRHADHDAGQQAQRTAFQALRPGCRPRPGRLGAVGAHGCLRPGELRCEDARTLNDVFRGVRSRSSTNPRSRDGLATDSRRFGLELG